MVKVFSLVLFLGQGLVLMAALQMSREWIGIQQFPPATQSKLLEILNKFKEEVSFLFLASSALCLFHV